MEHNNDATQNAINNPTSDPKAAHESLAEADEEGEEGGVSWHDMVLIAFVAGMLLLNASGLLTQIFGLDTALIVTLVGGYGIFWDSLSRLARGKIGGDLAVTIAAFAALAIGQYVAAAEVVLIMLIGTALESFAVGKTRNAIAALVQLAPTSATVLREGQEVTIAADQLQPGDHILIRPGERIPADGRVRRGQSAVDQAALTGESLPVPKNAGDTVYTGTINQLGLLEVEVEAVGEHTTLAHIIQLIEEAEANKAPVERHADRWASYFVPTIVSLGLLTFAWWYFVASAALDVALTRMASTLIIACPCALILATPTALAAAIGRCARRGILTRGGVHLETIAAVNCVIFDKTGTLTSGQPEVTEVIGFNGQARESVLHLAAVAEQGSSHPIAAAILKAYTQITTRQDNSFATMEPTPAVPSPLRARPTAAAAVRATASLNGGPVDLGTDVDLPAGTSSEKAPLLEQAEFRPGLGMVAQQSGRRLLVGNRHLLAKHNILLPDAVEQTIHALEAKGQTIVLVAEEQTPVGVITVADRIRPEATLAINGLKSLGLERIVMLSGDAASPVEIVARGVGIEEFKSGLFPADKVAYLRDLQAAGYRVAMVGDGINDAPSLAAADVGIAMGHGGADIAVAAADIIFVTDDLTRLPETIAISRRALRTVRRSILWFALGLNGLSVVLSASGGLAWIGNQLQNQWPTLFGGAGRDISPILAAIEHQIASLLVVGNSLRLLGGRVTWQPGDKPLVASPQPERVTGRVGAWLRPFIETPLVQAMRRAPTTAAETWRQHGWRIQQGAVLAVVACWLCSGFYCVPMGQVGVVQHFGQLVPSNAGPGLHYRIPWPVERVTVVNIAGIRRAEIGFRTTPRTASGWLAPVSTNSAPANSAPSEWSTVHNGNLQRVAEESLLLTGDEYLVDANLTLQYLVSDPARFLFQNTDAATTLREAGEASLRRAAEHTSLETLLTTGRAPLEARIQRDVQAACDHYQTGLTVLAARLQEVHPPQEVVAAYRDVSSAAEEKVTAMNQAEGYRNETIPLAHGQAAQNVALATGYTFDRLHRSIGDASRFLQMLNGYHLGPQVNADRIYLETVEQALMGPNKFIMDPAGGGRRQMWLSDGQLAGLPGLPSPETPASVPPVSEPAPGQGPPPEPGQ